MRLSQRRISRALGHSAVIATLLFPSLASALPMPAFSPATGSPFTLPTRTTSVAVGDFNGDTFPDLVVALPGTNQVSLLLNDTLGGFATTAAGSPMSVAGSPTGIAVGDINADAKLDWVASNATGGTLTIGIGDGLGGFTLSTTAAIAGATTLSSLKLLDLNNDGILDVVVFDKTWSAPKIFVVMGLGGGTFNTAAATQLTLPASSYDAWDMADVDGDGKLDIVAVGASSPAPLSVFKGDGLGGFTASTANPQPLQGLSFSYALALSDVNGDGNVDAVIGSLSTFSSVYLNGGAGLFNGANSYSIPAAAGNSSSHIYQFALGDANGDGKIDVAACGDSSGQLWLGDGVWGGVRFPQFTLPYTGWTWSSVLLGDWNLDGAKDLLFGGGALAVYLNQNTVAGQSPSLAGTQVLATEGTASNGTVTGTPAIAGTTLTYALAVWPSKGSVQLNTTTGGFIYTPYSQNNSVPSPVADSFMVVASDGTWESNTALVNVSITLTNAAPTVLGGSGSFKTGTTYNGFMNGSDPDYDPLTYLIVTQPAHGVLVQSYANSPSFNYVANTGYIGPDSFTFKANDGALDSNIATYSLTVRPLNSPPVVQNTSFSAISGWTNPIGITASDPDSDALTFSIVTPPAHGTTSIGAYGSINYTPTSGYTGPDVLTFKANDGQLDSNIGTVSIQVQPAISSTSTTTDPYSGSGVTVKSAVPVGCFIGMLGW